MLKQRQEQIPKCLTAEQERTRVTVMESAKKKGHQQDWETRKDSRCLQSHRLCGEPGLCTEPELKPQASYE